MTIRQMFSLAVALAVLASAGCGKSRGKLAGVVTLNGTPLPYGQVAVYGEKMEQLGLATVLDGAYEISDLPAGPVTLTVQTHQPTGQPVGAPPTPARVWHTAEAIKESRRGLPEVIRKAMDRIVPVPKRYTRSNQSDQKVTIVGGTTRFDVALVGQAELPPR